ncbi:MAG: GNAT family N-acetyltransferase [Cyclobacteriaceae bacterium]|nr:GNAT family N-acetyltransferase [Cyclobacteriaceae bacterium]
MKLLLHTSPKNLSLPQGLPLYFFPAFLALPQRPHSLLFEARTDNHAPVYFACTLHEKTATSLAKSPFGSFWSQEALTSTLFDQLLNELYEKLLSLGASILRISQPPDFYSGFVPPEWLEAAGFDVDTCEINQHMVLSLPATLHKMEKRKIHSIQAKGAVCRCAGKDELPVIHDFIAECRQHQGLTINISRENFLLQLTTFPDFHDVWVMEQNQELMAVCVTLMVTPDIAYTYLPATRQTFKKDSPMAGLLHTMSIHYQARGVQYLDLGLSSIQGIKQEGLFTFKQRMGALSKNRLTYFKTLR